MVYLELPWDIYLMDAFPAKPRRFVPGLGPPDAKIAIIGEAPGAYEDAQLKPFVGPAGNVLEQCLHAAGLIRSEVYLTNVVKERPPGNDISPFFNGKTFSPEGYEWVSLLREELNALNPNIMVACGKTAMAALTGRTDITRTRGYVFPSIALARDSKVIPTIHPAASLYDRKGGDKGALATAEFKPYLYRHVITCDLKKAKVESHFSELRRPERQIIWDFGNVNEVLEWLEYYEKQPLVATDIEVLNCELACISFSSNPSIAISIPLTGAWTEQDELLIWRGIQRVLGNANSCKVLQNSVFDCWFLATRCGIIVAGPIHDTMIGHSVMYPELPKSLGFIGSIYCGAQAYWKDAVKFSNIKEEA